MQNSPSLTYNTEFKGVQISQKINRENRSVFGQFLTSSSIARIIAGQFRQITGDVRLLDAGAGVGILTSAFVERILQTPENVTSCQFTAYEIEPKFIPILKITLSECCEALEKAGIRANYCILEDFLLEGSQHFSSPLLYSSSASLFTHSILNPPYKEINSDTVVKETLLRAGINTVNYYSAWTL